MWFKRRGRMARLSLGVVALVLALSISGCATDEEGQGMALVPGGDVENGRAVIREVGCGGCHVIPGVRGADALVGPPLTAWGNRQYIAGSLTNNPDNLIRWIREPQEIEPGTAMPDLGLSEAAARDIAAYLATLR